MAKDKTKRKQQKKARRQQRAINKRGVLPTSVQALLGYLGGGGPGPAHQGDVKLKERAGVDNIDTLAQIIRAQQMQSASYMQQLQQVAFKTDILQQLKTQGEESKKQIEETKTIFKSDKLQVLDEIMQVRAYNKQTTDAKIEKIQRKILTKTKKKAEQAEIDILISDLDALQRVKGTEIKFGYNAPAAATLQMRPDIEMAQVGIPSQQKTLGEARVGGGTVKISVDQAQSTSRQISAIDPMQSLIGSPNFKLSKETGRDYELLTNITAFGSSDSAGSSGNLTSKIQTITRSKRTGLLKITHEK